MRKRSVVIWILAIALVLLVFSCQPARDTVENVVKKVIKREVVPTCLDNDGDGFNTCEPNKDCNDNSADARPGINEACGDNLDNNCDGQVDENCCLDDDRDGYGEGCFLGGDCDDSLSGVNSGAAEICDNLDNNCDNEVDEGCVACVDNDKDGYGANCETGPDCDDTKASVNSGAAEVCDKLDNNCNNKVDEGLLLSLKGLIAWYPGEVDAMDYANGFHGVLREGAEFAEGKVGKGFSFDGKDDYVYFQDEPAFRLSEVTVEAWVKLDNPVGPAGKMIFDAAQEFESNGYSLYINKEGRVMFYVPDRSDPISERRVASETLLEPGIWYHVAGTYAAKKMKIYVNGEVEASTPQAAGINNLKTERRIGAQVKFDDRLDRFFDGVIDELSVYSRALSSEEIKAIYGSGSNGKCNTAS